MSADSPESKPRTLMVDATISGITTFEIADELRHRYLGGSYLGTHLWLESSRLEVHPLSAANALVVVPGLLTGLPVPAACMTSFVSKSPETGLLSESSVDGFFGMRLKAAGADALVIKGAFQSPSYIVVDGDSGTVDTHGAGVLWGMDTFEAFDILKERHGEDIDAALIGPAGENTVLYAGIVTGGAESKAAGRTGMGAVMGSKNLKAIVVRGGRDPRAVDAEGLATSTRDFAARVKEKGIPWGGYGAGGEVISAEANGSLPIQNWIGGSFPGAANIDMRAMVEKGIVVGDYSCWGCPIRCGTHVRLGAGEGADQRSCGPNFETIGAFGSMCLVDDPEYIVAANDLCNRLGLDPISTGSCIAFAMEAYERGVIDDEMAGRPIRWGDGDAVLFLINEIAYERGLGAILAKGVKLAAQDLGPLAQEFAVHVKGLELPMHDPRAYTSMAISYATGSHGACHLEGPTYYIEDGTYKKELLGLGDVDTLGLDNKAKAKVAVAMQDFMGAFSALGLCKLLLRAQVSPEELGQWVNHSLGWSLSGEDLLRAGERSFNLRRLCNVALGITRKDDTLPPRLLSQPRPTGKAKGSLPFLGEMLNEYYSLRGWDPEGVPTVRTLVRLGLDHYPERLGIKKRVLSE